MATETNTKWGILYCPRDGFMKNPHKRWERIENTAQSWCGVRFRSERACTQRRTPCYDDDKQWL